jgi:uncharacterized protein YqfB (UPF0267 family)
MRRRKPLEDDERRKFSAGEKVFSKFNTNLQMTVQRYSGKQYYCTIDNQSTKKEVLFFEEDLINEWQIPFY